MPISIAGMHRSGTSMVARLLNLCGLSLGPASHFLPAYDDNPEGFWESWPFIAVNDDLLGHRGGRWDLPPAPSVGWALDPGLQPLRERAASLQPGLDLAEPWGWKDPRNSLTLPFWLSVWPDLRVVVCVRHPLEVAQSLLERNGFSFLTSLNLWLAYYRALADAVPEDRRLVTHYDSYFHDPAAEVSRLCAWAGLAADEGQIQTALATIAGRLRHTRFSAAMLPSIRVPPEVVAMYDELCVAARIAAPAVPAISEPRGLESAIRLAVQMEGQAAERDRVIARLEPEARQVGGLRLRLDRARARRLRLAGHLRKAVGRAAAEAARADAEVVRANSLQTDLDRVNGHAASLAAQADALQSALDRECGHAATLAARLAALQSALDQSNAHVAVLADRLDARRFRYANALAEAVLKVAHPLLRLLHLRHV
ncbi:MAG: sulfotransferase family protein [Gemmataceae bacterium]